jgi:hypothetical protein
MWFDGGFLAGPMGHPLNAFFPAGAIRFSGYGGEGLFCTRMAQAILTCSSLGEDEVVQIMERPFLAGSRALSRTIASELIAAAHRHPTLSRRVLIREGQKRMRRFAAFISFEAVAEPELKPFVRFVFDEVARSVEAASEENVAGRT